MSDTRGQDPVPHDGSPAGASAHGDSAPTPPSAYPGAGHDPVAPGAPPAYVPPAYHAPVAAPAPYRTAPVRARGRGRAVAIALLGALAGGLIFAGGFYLADTMRAGVASPAPETVNVRTVVATDALEVAAAKVLPSVVNIAVASRSGSGNGSGIILTPDGYILTNNHVVEGATDIRVQFGADELVATLVGADPTTDIAVIRVQKDGLPAATIGSSTDLRVGQTVIAIGSPFGLDKTVTSGIVSALHRSDLVSSAAGLSTYTNLIQTDAAINPGNSGGALADLTGAVVGMNTLIQSPSGTLGAAQSAGIGFAIPIDFAKATAETIMSGKKVTHPYLGASTLTVTPEMAYYYGLPVSSGAYVQSVATGSPADEAGIRVNDIVVGFGASEIASVEDLFVAVNNADVGVKVPVQVDRNGRTVTLDVTLVAQ